MRYVIILEKALKPKEDEEEPGEKRLRMGTDVGHGNVAVGHKILVGDDEDTEAKVTAVGKDGVTARDKKGKTHQILHKHIKVKEDEDEEDEDERWGETSEDEREDEEEKQEKEKIPTVEEFLKQEKWKKDEWIQASMLARLMETSLKDVKQQLLDLSNVGLVQLVSEDPKHSDLLYRYTDAKRAPHEAKPTSVKLTERTEETKFEKPKGYGGKKK
jgi:ribosomal protein S25